MLLDIRTSSTEMIPINDFQYLCDLAKCTKCQMFTVLKYTNKLYGASDDCCCIHEVDIPFLVNTDLMFRLDTIDQELLKTYKNFFIPEKFNWVILPDYYWEMYVNGDLIADFDIDQDLVIIKDKTTGIAINQIQMFKVRACNDVPRSIFMNQLEGLINRIPRLKEPSRFIDIHNDKAIREAYDSKAAMGRFLCRMKNDTIDVAFYFYKGLFALAKADSLDLEIRFDRYDTLMFMATFLPKKKKNPLTFNTYGVAFQERIHCMFINII